MDSQERRLGSANNSQRLSFLLKDSVVYGGAAALSKATMLITFPVLARYFSVEEFGVLDFYTVLTGMLVVGFVFGQDSAVARFYYEYNDHETRKKIISESFYFQLFVTALLLSLLYLNVDNLSAYFPDSGHDHAYFLFLSLLLVPFSLLINFSVNILKWTFKRNQFLIISLGYSVTQSIAVCGVTLFLSPPIETVLYVHLLVGAMFGVCGLRFVKSWLILPRNFSHLAKLLKFAAPYGLICLLVALSPTIERALTSQMLSPIELGRYAVATKIALILTLVSGAFQTAWGPFSLSLYKKDDAGVTYDLVAKCIVLMLCILVFFISASADFLVNILASSKYEGVGGVIFPLAMAVALNTIAGVLSVGINISKKSYLNLYAFSISFVATILSIVHFIPLLGLYGVALGVMIGAFIKLLIQAWLAQRAFALPWSYSAISVVLLATLIFGLLEHWLALYQVVLCKEIFFGLASIFIMGLGWKSMFSFAERRMVFQYFRSKFT